MVLPVPVAAMATGTFWSGLPNASVAVTVIVLKSLPELAAIEVGAADTVLFEASRAPACAVAWNVTGFPLTPPVPMRASIVFGPATVPRVHLPTVALPSAPVIWFSTRNASTT